MRVAVLAFADYPDTWAATETGPGLNFTTISVMDSDFAPVAEAISVARSAADLVVFSIHWGPNMRERPPLEFRHFAHRVVDEGVDVFWGHSAHIVQGVEFRNGSVILYDAGDFVDDYAVDPRLRNDLGALFVVRAIPHHVEEVSLVPARIDHMQVNWAVGQERSWLIRRMELLCHEFGTGIEGDGGPVRFVSPAHV
jgi:poly-gamma-glutamate synthesis protein (capsule biosynthesis protein)